MAVVTQGCHCFFQGESYIRQHPRRWPFTRCEPRWAPGSIFCSASAIAIVFVWIVNGMGNVPALLSLMPTLLLLFLVGWSLAVCMGVANVVFQDSQHLIDVVMQILFYVTPIIYKTDRSGRPAAAGLVRQSQSVRRSLGVGSPAAVVRPAAVAAGRQPGALTGVLAVAAAALALKHFEKRMIFYL